MTKRVYQDIRDTFYFDFAEIICDCEGNCPNVGLRLKFRCGLNTFIENINSLQGVCIVHL